MTPNEETALIGLAVSGDEAAFSELYRDNNKKIYYTLLRLTHNQEDAEDLLSETFQAAFLKLSTFKGDSRISTWIHRIAVNIFNMSMRRKRLLLVPFSEDLDLKIQENGYKRVQVSEAMNSLHHISKRSRSILVMRTIYGFTNQEVAEHFGLPLTATKSYLHRIRKRIRKFRGN